MIYLSFKLFSQNFFLDITRGYGVMKKFYAGSDLCRSILPDKSTYELTKISLHNQDKLIKNKQIDFHMLKFKEEEQKQDPAKAAFVAQSLCTEMVLIKHLKYTVTLILDVANGFVWMAS